MSCGQRYDLKRVLNSPSVYQQHVPDNWNYERWNFTWKHFLCLWFKQTLTFIKELNVRHRQTTNTNEFSMKLACSLTFLSPSGHFLILSFCFFGPHLPSESVLGGLSIPIGAQRIHKMLGIESWLPECAPENWAISQTLILFLFYQKPLWIL